MTPYEMARSIASTLVTQHGSELTAEHIREAVVQVAGMPAMSGLSSTDREQLVREIEAAYQTVIGEERTLVGTDDGWEPWFPRRKGEITWNYWQRYEQLLQRGSMGPGVRARLDRSTDTVLAQLGDPSRPDSWDRRGLVVGLVQSGKTSHYIGLINKAVDAGYKVVVILTGFTESLRVQTQIRAEEGFLGYYREPGTRRGEEIAHRVGVGLIPPDRRPDSATTRNNDFRAGTAGAFGIHIGRNEILFVIKKNVSVLGRLINWIQNFGDAVDAGGRHFVKGAPLLVIDDESDVGSIDTRKGNIIEDDPEPDHEPSRINEQIRRLLWLFDQSSYVGYTATPYANVLMHENARTDKLGEDLFPRSFIVSLPTPSNHVGPTMVFGSGTDAGDDTREPLPIVRRIPVNEVEGESAWIPPVHKKTHAPLYEGFDEVPPSLREAILSFVLVCTARRLRGTGTRNDSMLVHVTRFNDVQRIVGEQVENALKGIVDRLRTGTADEGLLAELRRLWERDFIPTTLEIAERGDGLFDNPTHEWKEIKDELLVAASAIQVRLINGLAGEVLDYETHREDGLHVIAIGGDKLSRGLTLDGLSVSYFLRCSRMYDTLMQMGRWFGYRPGYLDLCRLYTTAELCDWFEHIAAATEELREEFDIMASSGQTPRDFGLRVRSHPELMVTSQVKMRHGQTIQITFDGDIVETVNFRRDADTVEKNWEQVRNLVAALSDGGGVAAREVRPGSLKWTAVDAIHIIGFLDGYRAHDQARKVKPPLLREYIQKEVSRGRLTSWTVLVSGGSRNPEPVGDAEVKLVERGWHLMGRSGREKDAERATLIKGNHYRIGRLVNPPDEYVDLSVEEYDEALRATVEAWKHDPGFRSTAPDTPSGRQIRNHREADTGLLIIYPLIPDEEKAAIDSVPITGFAISFPEVDTEIASTVTYTVNNVYQQLELDYA